MESTESLAVDSNYTNRPDDGTSSYTLSSATSRYRFEHGRTYHTYRDGAYWGPNDDQALNHELIIHHLCLLTLRDRLFLAPIKNPKRILDVGTGRGLWATDMADMFPSAKVIGVDLSLPPPEPRPNNIEFIMDDAASGWEYSDKFDFIHIRGLFGSISDWPALYAQVLNNLQPGGWFQQIEWSVHQHSIHGPLGEDHILVQWAKHFVEIGERNGKSMEIAEKMEGLIRQAGFVDIVSKTYKWPIGPWSSDARTKKIGQWHLKNWREGIEGWSLALFTRILGWKPEDVKEMNRRVFAAITDRKLHAYNEVRLVYGRKPSS